MGCGLKCFKKPQFKAKQHVPNTFIRNYHHLTTHERKLAGTHGKLLRIRHLSCDIVGIYTCVINQTKIMLYIFISNMCLSVHGDMVIHNSRVLYMQRAIFTST